MFVFLCRLLGRDAAEQSAERREQREENREQRAESTEKQRVQSTEYRAQCSVYSLIHCSALVGASRTFLKIVSCYFVLMICVFSVVVML